MIPISDGVWIAALAVIGTLFTTLITGVVAPLVMARRLNRNRQEEKDQEYKNRQEEKDQDYARQDLVASRAEAASRALLLRQDEATRALEESTRNAAVAQQQTQTKLTSIVTMVDGNLTLVLDAELNSTRRELAALIELKELKIASGKPVSIETTVAIEQANARVVKLEKDIAKRRETDELAKAQIEEANIHAVAAAAAEKAAPKAAQKAAREIVPPVVAEEVPPVVKEAVKEALQEHDAASKAKKGN